MSPALYWGLRNVSPLIMLVGMVSGGWLFVRAILVWGVGTAEYVVQIDMPIAGAFVALWVVAVAMLLRPPRSVLARAEGPFTGGSVLVWALGRRFRFWMVLATPLCGLLGALALFTVPTALGCTSGIPADLLLGVPLAIGLTAGAGALIWIVSRSALHGVELTTTQLIAYGYFRSRRYPRRAITSVSAATVPPLLHAVLSTLMNRDVDLALQLTLDDGSNPLLYASNSHLHDVESGVEIVRAWRCAPE